MPEVLSTLVAWLPWIIVGFCVLSEAFFAASELSIISANAIRLEEAAREGSSRAERVLWFRRHPDRLFGTTLLGTNLSTVTGSTIASLMLLQVDPDYGQWWAMLLMSPLILVIGEIVPKSLGQARADAVSQWLAGPLYVVHRALAIPMVFVRAYTRALYTTLKIDPDSEPAMASREELVLLMEMETDDEPGEDAVNADEREMIQRILAFSHLEARDSMVPLVEIVAVPADATVESAVRAVARAGVSRLPVYRDRVDNIVGLLHHLDLFQADHADQPISELMSAPYFVPESQEVDEILILLQREAASAAIVVDEFGGAVGLLTLEDVLEEIVGEIHDEYDRDGGVWKQVADGWLIDARAPVERINEEFGLDLPTDDDYETLAGYLLDEMRHIPRIGEQVNLPDGRAFTVRRATARAIQEVHFGRPKGA